MARRLPTLTGDRELIQSMRVVTSAVSGKTLDRLCRESLEPMRVDTVAGARARRQVGYNPPGGHLDEGVVVVKVAERGRGYRHFWLSFRNRARYIAHLVEYGTLPHWQPRRGIMHPGARPFPFIRPAFEARKGETLTIFARRSWELIRNYTLGVTKRRRR